MTEFDTSNKDGILNADAISTSEMPAMSLETNVRERGVRGGRSEESDDRVQRDKAKSTARSTTSHQQAWKESQKNREEERERLKKQQEKSGSDGRDSQWQQVDI